MSTMVTAGSVTMTSNTASAEELTEVLAPSEEKPEKPKVRMDRGVPVEDEPKEGLSKAASDLGKEGAKAAAKARKAREKADAVDPKGAARSKGHEEVSDDAQAVDEDEGEQEARKLQEELDAEPDVAKRKERARERVAEATRKARQERLRADHLAAEVQRLKSAPPAQQAPPQPSREAFPAQPETKTKPREEDFDTYGEFVEALADFKAEEKLAAHTKAQERETFARDFADRAMRSIDTFRNKVAEAIKADPDLEDTVIPFAEVVRNSSHGIPPGGAYTPFNVVNDEILRSNIPAQLMTRLNSDEGLMDEILSLPSRDAIARKMVEVQTEIRLSLGSVTAGTPPTRRAVSQAPPPIRPVTGAPRTATTELDDNAPLSAHVKAFGERELKARSR